VEEASPYDQWFAAHLAAKRARRVQHARFIVGIAVGAALVALLTENPGAGFRLGIVLGIIYGAVVVIENTFINPKN